MVFTGGKSDRHARVVEHARKLGLAGQVRFLGFVSPLELQAAYRLARMLVFPSRFEGFGMPVVEAFRVGLPVACSNATSLPEVAGGAALLFDPEDTAGIAETMKRLWLDEALQRDLSSRGRERSAASPGGRPRSGTGHSTRLVAGRGISREEQESLRSDDGAVGGDR